MSAVEPRFVDANGLRFAVLEEGEGPLVLLLHGFPDTARTWDVVRPRLAAAGFRVACPYLRGYAPTALPERDTDVETLGRDVLALIAALGEERAIVIGHDWGALAALAAASLAPARVAQLVTIAIPHPASLRPTPPKVWGVRHFVAYKLPGAASRFAADDFAALPEICRRWSPTWTPTDADFADVKRCFADRKSLDAAFGYYRALPFRMPAFLRAPITVPTISVGGADDPLATPDDYEHARRMFTSTYDVVIVPGGHFLHREQPELLCERLLARLR